MRIRKLDTKRAQDVRQFIHFPFELYRGNPKWVPPLISDMKFVLNRDKHPFYRHSTADFFTAESKGQTLGRIAVVDNQNYNRYNHSKAAFFYYFEVVEDVVAARALLNTAFDWANKRGLDTIIGPKGLLQGDGLGLLVEGFEYLPAMGIAYNPPYYGPFVTDLGFEKLTDYLSGHLHRGFELPQRVFAIAERVKVQRGFWIKHFESKREMRQWVPRIRQVYNQAFVNVPVFCPITEEEVQVIADRIISLAPPQLIKLVMKGDELVGFLLAYPNISAALQKVKGKVWPLGWIHIQREFKRTKWLDVNGIGLLPQHQGVGANAVLYTALEESLREFDFEHANVVQISEHNMQSMGEMKALGVEWCKRHRLYRRAL